MPCVPRAAAPTAVRSPCLIEGQVCANLAPNICQLGSVGERKCSLRLPPVTYLGGQAIKLGPRLFAGEASVVLKTKCFVQDQGTAFKPKPSSGRRP